MQFDRLSDTDVAGKTVLIRADMNVPLRDGEITDDTRIRASLDSILYCLQQNAAVIVMTHLGRPTEGQPRPEDSVAPVAERLSALLNMPVQIAEDLTIDKNLLERGSVTLLQNVRLNAGEKKNDKNLGAAYARLCDVFANDAFGTAHRAEASTSAVAECAPAACAGLLLASELEALSRVMDGPQRPLAAVVGGSKVSTKLTVLDSLSERVDDLIVGGGIANTFLLAAGFPVGRSLVEADLVKEATSILEKMRKKGGRVPLPTDVVVASSVSADAAALVKKVTDVGDNDMILDVGPESAAVIAQMVKSAGTVVWNGPLGVFELEPFAGGTRVLAEAIADGPAFSVAGGGDTLAAVARFGVSDRIGYISTGGGAFLELLEGKTLPAVAVLEARAASRRL